MRRQFLNAIWAGLLVVLLPYVLWAQGSEIKGRVTDRLTGEPMPGVVLLLKGTTQGTETTRDGSFALKLPKDKIENTLIVRFLGYREQQILLTGEISQEPLLISLEEDRLKLDEVVVTGQGMNISKRRLSTDVVSIGEKELKETPGTRIDQLLQAKLPNAQIKLTGGQAGASSIIRSRGVNSAFLNSTPIIYVDGVRMDNLNTKSAIGGGSAQGAAISAIADIPLDNIEKVEFINGGAATTLYGSDAANGVIQIITKKGGAERTEITLDTQMGPETPTSDFLFFDRSKELLFQNGFFQKHNIGLSGGQGSFGYSFSGGYLKSSGVQLFNSNSNERIDLRTGFRAGLGSKLIYESSFSYVNNRYKRTRNGNQGGYTGLWFAESGASSITGPKFNPDLNAQTPDEFEAMKAYVSEAERLQNNGITVNRFQTSQVFRYHPLENLVLKATGGVDYRVQQDQVVQTNQYLTHTTGNPTTNQGSISNFDRKYLGLTFEANGQHEAKVGDFSFVTTLGGQLFRNEDQQVAYRGENIRDGALTITGAALKTSDEYFSEVVNYGVYLQENIGFQNKLFLDLGIRGDGNSAFGENIGAQYYPKIGFSYIPSSDPYFDRISALVSSAKIRGNYGLAGNFPTPFANDRTIAFSGFLGEQASYFGQPGNTELKPEKVATFEVGTDIGFLKGRIVVSAGYYYSTTTDALFVVPPAPSTGESNQLKNIGEIRNKGFEFKATVVPIETSDFTLSAYASYNTLDNKVVSSGGAAPFNINGFSARTIQTVVQEGYPIGFLRGNYGYFNEAGVLDRTEAQQFLGTTIPDLFGSMGLNLRYKKLSFFANADYQKGAYASSFDRQFRFNYGASNEGIPQAEIDANKRVNWLNFTNMFVEKTDYLKVRTIGANLSLKPQLWNGLVKSLAIGFTVVNPFNFTSSSFDPETSISGSAQGQGGATTGGISYATYSAPRQFLGSLRFSF